MEMSLITFTTTMTILIGTKCINSDQAYPMLTVTPETQSSATSETAETITEVDPLPPNIFTPLVCEFLSPDMFSHRDDLLAYFITKATKESKQQDELIGDLNLYITNDKLPQHYMPYAKLALSLLSCMDFLGSVKWHVLNIREFAEPNAYSNLPPSYRTDAQLSGLFSSDIFSTNDPVPILIRKLLNVSQNDMNHTENELRKIFETDMGMYFGYAKYLYDFFRRPSMLLSLQSSVDEMQRILKTDILRVQFVNSHQAYPMVPATVETQSTAKFETAEIISEVDPLPPTVFTPLIREFLSTDMFCHRNDLLTYFFTKDTKLPKQQDELIGDLNLYITNDELPDRYKPYAKLAFSLLRCMKQLECVEKQVQFVRYFSWPKIQSTIPQNCLRDEHLSRLFSCDIFSNDNPVLYLLRKLLILKVSENDINRMLPELRKIIETSFGAGMYLGYAKCLYGFFSQPSMLKNLRTSVDKMQHILKVDISRIEK